MASEKTLQAKLGSGASGDGRQQHARKEAEKALSASMIRDMEACVLLIQDKVTLLEKSGAKTNKSADQGMVGEKLRAAAPGRVGQI